MTMKPLYTLLLVFLMPVVSIGQKVVVIDTLYELDKYELISPAGIYQATMPIGYLCNGKNGNVYLKSFVGDKTDHHFEYKNGEVVGSRYKVVMVIDVDSFCDSDFELLLCMGDKGSGLRIQHIDEYPNDTIRIAKWQMFYNDLVDTLVSANTIDNYVNGDPQGVAEMSSWNTIVLTQQAPDTLKKLTINVNDSDIQLPLDIIRKEIPMTSQGPLSKKDVRIKRRFERYKYKHDDIGKKRFKYQVVHVWSMKYVYYYEATLDLSTAP